MGVWLARDTFVDQVQAALYVSKVVAYAQGFDQIAAGAEELGWSIDLDDVATIWRGRCIIRAQSLDGIRETYADEPDLTTLLTTGQFAEAVQEGADAWREVVATAARGGVPVPAFGSSSPTPTACAAPGYPPRFSKSAAGQLQRPHLAPCRSRGHLTRSGPSKGARSGRRRAGVRPNLVTPSGAVPCSTCR